MLSIAFGERRAFLTYDNEGFSRKRQAEDLSGGATSNSFTCSHLGLNGGQHTYRQIQAVLSTVSSSQMLVFSTVRKKKSTFLSSSPSALAA